MNPGRPIATALLLSALSAAAGAQEAEPALDRVLTAGADRAHALALPQDRGAAGLWHRLIELTTTASVLHTTAHPDDEHADVLTLLARRDGVRTALLTLNRGEGGANAIGPELFDGVGLIRTEELLLSGRYYGLDDQYFTTAVDYGYSKTLDEAYRSWNRDAVLEDMVRILRLNRPLVVVSRFHGSDRDGHGHHQAAGDLTPEAVRAAGDPSRFPDQITREGLRPWQPLKLYRGGVLEDEFHHLVMEAGVYSPWLGASYRDFAFEGLSLQRSQTSGRRRAVLGAVPRRYERLQAHASDSVPAVSETSFLDGLDTSLSGVFGLAREAAPEGATALLKEAERSIGAAIEAFDPGAPAATVPHLASALRALRRALALAAEAPEARFLLRIEERQLEDALAAAAGIRLESVASDTADAAPGPFDLPTLEPVVQAQEVLVHTTLTSPGALPTASPRVRLLAGDGWIGTSEREGQALASATEQGGVYRTRHVVTLPGRIEPTRPPFHRDGLARNTYEVGDSAVLHLPWGRPALTAEVTVDIGGQPITLRAAVRTRESVAPYGHVLRELTVVPKLSVRMEPAVLVAPLGPVPAAVEVVVEVTHAGPGATRGTLRIDRERGWAVEPATYDLRFDRPGQRRSFTFRVTPDALEARPYPIVAAAVAGGRSYREGYQVVRYPDLETRHLYRLSSGVVRGVDLRVAEDLSVGYVMGVGDQLPQAMAQLGASVTELDDLALASADLAGFDAIVVGTRAYAVRPQLNAQNQRLLEYVEGGGHMVVLYQTQEFVPEGTAPFTAQLPRDAEEVSEEDAPVTLLEPDHPLLRAPNRITSGDFDGWIEQRGSKFFSEWDPAYTPLVETRDTGQEAQRGVWVTAEYGAGRYTYCALALHRQLPSGVPGAYRILANLLSASRE